MPGGNRVNGRRNSSPGGTSTNFCTEAQSLEHACDIIARQGRHKKQRRALDGDDEKRKAVSLPTFSFSGTPIDE